ncbi:MAG: DUF933 domain-containing protein [Candidatus Omnitrophica bacterium]|nr:DUF933 domain-containing protein [Candidatus Omnitrophota bacterium]
MKIGIIGPSQSGKSTLLKVLLQAGVSGDIGVFKSADPRVDGIFEIFSSKKRTYPETTFIDLGALSSFAKKDLSKLQDIDLFICVIGAVFSQDPKKDFEKLITDIIVTDLEVVQNRIERLKKESRPDKERESKILERYQNTLSEGKVLYKAGLDEDEIRFLSGMVFLSLKPLILAINISDNSNKTGPLEEYAKSLGIQHIYFCGKIESEVLELEPQERNKFLKEMGIGHDLREELSKLISKKLDLITFFTTGDKETKGWYLKSGLPAIEAAGKIHSDMKRGFIRAEVVNYGDFIKCGSMHKAREAGVLKVEGKEYIVRDGDIINIRFNI